MNTKQIDLIKSDVQEAVSHELNKLEKLKNKSIYISGASGFVGKWILETINYLNDHHQFNIKVHASSRTIQEQALKFPHIFKQKNIHSYSLDIKNLMEIPSECTYVLHLAASPDNREHVSDPIRIMNDITLGGYKLLEATTRLDELQNVVMFSSGQVYGKQPHDHQHISEDQFFPFNPATSSASYGEAKRLLETMSISYKSFFKIPLTILRPFAFIGPYQSLTRPWAINNFMRDCTLSQPIRILGDQSTMRSYMYPSEMSLWTLVALANPQTSQSMFNLGSSDAFDLKSIAEIVERTFAKNNGIIQAPQNSQIDLEKSKFIPAIAKIEHTFQLKLKIGTQKAIEKSIQWFQLHSS